MPLVVISHVIPNPQNTHSVTSLRNMQKTLLRQGQIEPLQVKFHSKNDDGTETYVTHRNDVWGNEIVLAARALGWSHILIHITDRYEF